MRVKLLISLSDYGVWLIAREIWWGQLSRILENLVVVLFSWGLSRISTCLIELWLVSFGFFSICIQISYIYYNCSYMYVTCLLFCFVTLCYSTDEELDCYSILQFMALFCLLLNPQKVHFLGVRGCNENPRGEFWSQLLIIAIVDLVVCFWKVIAYKIAYTFSCHFDYFVFCSAGLLGKWDFLK